jgi:probable HAF family extracellular repeat protein
MTNDVRSIINAGRFFRTIAIIVGLASMDALWFPSASVAAATQAPAYTLTDLGSLPHVPDDMAMQINNKGQVSLWVPASSFSVKAAVWTGTKIRQMSSTLDYPTSVARAVNDQGQVVGWVSSSRNPVDSAATVRAVIYTDGAARVLGTLGGRGSRAFGVDPRGRTVGVADLADGRHHAFLEDGRNMTDLGTLPGGVFSQAYSINASGTVAGIADSSNARHAVLWRKGRIQDLGTLPGGDASCAVAINDKDQIAGYSASADGYHAFLYSNGKMQDLGTLGDDPSAASGLNNRGDVVGASSITETSRHAFLWHGGRMYDLNKLTPPASGWLLIAADAINDRGQIACVGYHNSGPARAVLLTPRQAF